MALYLEGKSCGSPKLDRPDHIDFSTAWKEQSGNMLAILLGLFQLIWLFGRGHYAVVPENLALRQQLVIYKRKKKRPRLVGRDRWFALSAVWKDWRRPLFVVHHGGTLAAGAFPQVLAQRQQLAQMKLKGLVPNLNNPASIAGTLQNLLGGPKNPPEGQQQTQQQQQPNPVEQVL